MQPSWNFRKFFALHCVALFLLLSLLWITPLRHLWQELDIALFRALNGYIKGRPLQQVFWATANIKITDLFGAFYLLFLYLTFIFEEKGLERKKRIAALFFTIIWFEISILTCKQVLTPICEYYKLSRHSPTVDLHDFISLSNVLPWLKVKDSSYFCFPADHGAIIIQWCLFFTFFAGRSRGIIAFLFALFLLLPRLISGAHWFSDLAVGSVSICLIAYAWATATPLFAHIQNLCQRLARAR